MSGKSVNTTEDIQARKAFIYHLLKDIEALEYMLNKDLFPNDKIRLGAEQELSIVDHKMKPICKSLEILEQIESDLFTTELSQFNLEINLEPLVLESGVFRTLHSTLQSQISYLKEKSKDLHVNFPLVGILPTLEHHDFDIKNITPYQRYLVLNDVFKIKDGEPFRLKISGIDELTMNLNSILAESGNTSFQIHLQLKPGEYKQKYNWAQMIAGPVLSACTNSPLLLGRELWAETRIALFQQAIDSRNSVYLLREQRPRVTFGHDWVHNCVSEIFKTDISHYPLLITADVEEDDAFDSLSQGKPPKMKALGIHNGNIYKWNRLCYGVSEGKPHLRIENRYIPTGPSLKDEVANVAFWIGLMNGMPEQYKDLPQKMDFKLVRQNFYKAAKHGLKCQFEWFGKSISAKELLIDELLPLAEKGLEKLQIPQDEIQNYLDIVKQRIKQNKTGSDWISNNYNQLKQHYSKRRVASIITQHMLANQEKDIPAHQWKDIKMQEESHNILDFTVSDVMTIDLVLVHEDDPILILKHLMKWNQTEQILVENDKHDLVGIVNLNDLQSVKWSNKQSLSVKTIMHTNVDTINPEADLSIAKAKMEKENISSLPVISDGKLVGILNTVHFKSFAKNA